MHDDVAAGALMDQRNGSFKDDGDFLNPGSLGGEANPGGQRDAGLRAEGELNPAQNLLDNLRVCEGLIK